MSALTSMTNGSLTGKREQTVLTPRIILAPLQARWGRISLDPCAAPKGLVWVPCTIKGCKGVAGRAKCRHCRGLGGVFVSDQVHAESAAIWPINGLGIPWVDRTFCNPPYDKLAPWLAKGTGPGRTAWLVPVRPHRKWWRAWARRVDVIVYLDPFAFEGHSSTFPAPMCLGYRGADAKEIALAYTEAGLGSCI